MFKIPHKILLFSSICLVVISVASVSGYFIPCFGAQEGEQRLGLSCTVSMAYLFSFIVGFVGLYLFGFWLGKIGEKKISIIFLTLTSIILMGSLLINFIAF
ncbi:MAG: hypothetical protein A2667_01260 [Candidatus Wildermuthbacteria bacterium RIFCSPHIGHO2_01_FULL_47_27]|uniref:Uncharacterized protein n=2 Tax=Candidatus Wildermuthiibacteriota TaxID=1817923 RepID=A0A1G2RR93_9BACT|nr:MAG: hypothetical protein A2667_01260 [Candidatus Wildermuthbacteria bacterium RIFCSPHIGHO2_01_FULL_47_27]OHA67160.1 MAG: hypothetical protein A3D59_02730 [Candidatus Wildermuthbacteria bacterium RIFCSPHIGHO2_02_FULL_47_17]OHA75374.1 MAG: hypothetical protein A3A32_01530 [Candidatus Wildermuthbacteria bacterium RIFCSPLOWO2_01_FULL_48_35]